MYEFRVLGTLNWDLRWIMTRALLRDTRSFSYGSAARPKYTFRLLVKWLWTPEGFQAPNPIHFTKHYFGPKAINSGNW